MADVVEGQVFNFKVVGRNSALREVALSDAAVSLDNAALGSVTVNPDGTGGVFTAGSVDGSGNLVATAAGVTSAPFPVNVTADNVVATVEIQPDPVTSVEVKPQ